VRETIDEFGGRRFLMCIGCAAICTLLVWHGKITSEDFKWIILGTVATYVGGNTTQKIKEPKPDENIN
jgi:hypothetical protein